MKPLSNKNLSAKYQRANISEKESELLHKYLLCFSNLYGCIQIGDLWQVFKQYKEKITKNKFLDFIDIVQREENDYVIFNLKEVYSAETRNETIDKLLVNKLLVKKYYAKFFNLKHLEELKVYKNGPYIPDKEELFTLDHDCFYESIEGQALVNFLSNLKTSGFDHNKYISTNGELFDLDGNSTKDKYIKDVIGFTYFERSNIEYADKREKEREYLINSYSVSFLQKALDLIRDTIQVYSPFEISTSIRVAVNFVSCELGVELSGEEKDEFLTLYTNLMSSSYRWSMFGFKLNDLIKETEGFSMQKMADEDGELAALIEEKILDIVTKWQNEAQEENDYQTIIDENEKYLKLFRTFLKKRNYSKKKIEGHVGRVEYYINDYLMWGLPKPMEDGCSEEVIGFIENRVNEKVYPASVSNIGFFLGSISLFYECMVENRIIDRNIYREFIEDIKYAKEEMVEDYYDKNPKEIDLYYVVDTIEMAHDYGFGYINVKTGEREFTPNDLNFCDGDLDEIHNIIDGPNWEMVPEFREYDIMSAFVSNLANQKQHNRLNRILHNKKAYRNFKDALYEMNIQDDYYEFYQETIEDLAKEWLEDYCDQFDPTEFDTNNMWS